jgi:hypothetical protein
MTSLFSLFSRRSEPLARISRYRGCARGWELTGSPRALSDAQRLVAVWAQIDPAATLRISSL